ncbi:VWA domain-containing protein [Flavobacterium agrisoli]|uniref:VWA domain-containing protein n=1 Tax=Flavobacterium agrisoli TaxID=2793066 RepID=A0A934PNM0_9FLAO|nr:VWA domain-containing protein [Flavobacterium agrisoli]MBK0370099.1 VWA domain-containing protein [Flavobacterium agrisoli]
MEVWKNIDWKEFHFLRPEYLWMGIPMLLIIVLGILLYGRTNPWKKKIAKHLQPYVIQKGTTWKSRFIHFSLLILFAIGFVAFLGPTWNKEKSPAKKVATKLVIALDLSQSMLATDISPNRLEYAKFKITDFLKANPRAETALIVFSASSHTVVPFTTDYKIITDNLDGLQPHMMPRRGTGFKALFSKVQSVLTSTEVPSTLLLITDDLDGVSIPEVTAFLENQNCKINFYPFASESGANVPSFSNHKVALRSGGKIVHSALIMDKVKQLEAIEKVSVMQPTLDKSDVKKMATDISDHLMFDKNSDKKDENWQDNGYWLLIPLMALFLFCFRKGWSLMAVLLLVSLSSCNGIEDKTKAKFKNFQFADLWYTKEYQAQQEYDKKNYLKAAKNFKDPMHKGVAYYKAGNLIQARNAFRKDTTAEGQYNLGLTYAKLGDLERAESVFKTLVAENPSITQAQQNLQKIQEAMLKVDKMSVDEKKVGKVKPNVKNKQNDSNEDLGGGGQKATKKDMQTKRQEEEVATGKRKGKELDELPDDFKSGKGSIPKNILMRKVDDDPALFLKKKFNYQVKKRQVEVEKTPTAW